MLKVLGAFLMIIGTFIGFFLRRHIGEVLGGGESLGSWIAEILLVCGGCIYIKTKNRSATWGLIAAIPIIGTISILFIPSKQIPANKNDLWISLVSTLIIAIIISTAFVAKRKSVEKDVYQAMKIHLLKISKQINNIPNITVKDIDGNVYHTVKIGNQIWTSENIRTTRYNDGTSISFDTSYATWANATTPKYCYYNNETNVDSATKYGALYNWYVIDPASTKKLAPTGWHVPTVAEWDSLENYLIANGYNWDTATTSNKIAKAMASKTDWTTSTTVGAIGNDLTLNNQSGFSALPGGCRSYNLDFQLIGGTGFWWSASKNGTETAYARSLNYGYDDLNWDENSKSCGYSIRLVMD